MSVIAFEPEKFGAVATTLKLRARDYAWVFHYPTNWDKSGTLESVIDAWCFDLLRANHFTSERQYGERPGGEQRLPRVIPLNQVALYKSLSAIRYNLVDNAGGETNFNDCYALLERMIGAVANDIIRKLPEYEKAPWS